MARNIVTKEILDVGLIPVIRASSSTEAIAIAKAIEAGGVSIVEVTMTVPRALHVIEKITDYFGDKVLVGAGTVLDSETTRSAMLSGAEFIVSPVLKRSVIEICKRYSKTVIPGAMTPTEVLTAWEAGADLVKIFPCDSLGGAKYLKALKGPLPQVLLIPTGGVKLELVGNFISAGASALGVGSELVNKEAVASQNFEHISSTARKFLQAIHSARQ